MIERIAGQPIAWYWIPVDRKALVNLTRKSNLLGALQTLGFLGILACTGCAAYYSGIHWAWYVTAGLLFLHGSCWAFLSNALHEFSHGTVFSTRLLNRAFLCLVSFLSWNNPTLFWASHTEHHKFTLYESDDQEVSVHASPTLCGYLQIAFVNPAGLLRSLGMTFRHAFGKIEGEWEKKLFPPAAAQKRRGLSRWAWMLLSGHGALIALSIYFHLWMLPVVVTLAPFYGRGIQWLCNESQHTGLPGNVPDFRLCSRTIYLNPVLQFLYWHMNYHTDHHLFANVPCYRLSRLHLLIQADLPPCAKGLLATWRQIAATLRRQKVDPSYRHAPLLPPRRSRWPAARA